MTKKRAAADLNAAIDAARAMMSIGGELALLMRRLADVLGISPMADIATSPIVTNSSIS